MHSVLLGGVGKRVAEVADLMTPALMPGSLALLQLNKLT